MLSVKKQLKYICIGINLMISIYQQPQYLLGKTFTVVLNYFLWEDIIFLCFLKKMLAMLLVGFNGGETC